jgi:5-(carboxyamino)imidazole ribonucleotide synthase
VVIGILGGGQLGRMLALAAANLGVRTRCYSDTADACAAGVSELHVGGYDDPERLARFAVGLDAATWEFENVPVVAARLLAQRVPLAPPAEALATGQDRLEEKALFRRLGIAVPEFAPVASVGELRAALARTGTPAVLKTRRGGYDGKGQVVIRDPAEAEAAVTRLGGGSVPLIVEAFAPFKREVSIIIARGRDGSSVCYPLTTNEHRGGILRCSTAGPVPDPLQPRAEALARQLAEALGYVGVLAIELFDVAGELLANELAPRVHNSGHWTMDGAVTSQFENHVRAVAGLPLGQTTARGFAGMLNLIGDHPPAERLLALPGARLHLYGKEPRAGRKVGHVNFCEASASTLADHLATARAMIDAHGG